MSERERERRETYSKGSPHETDMLEMLLEDGVRLCAGMRMAMGAVAVVAEAVVAVAEAVDAVVEAMAGDL